MARQLIANLQASGLIRSARVADAMGHVDRKHYAALHASAYDDSPQPIGHGATISAPHMHAEAAEHLADLISRNARVLDVGCGSGYLLGVFHEMAKSGAPDGRATGARIVGIDHIHGQSSRLCPALPCRRVWPLTHSLSDRRQHSPTCRPATSPRTGGPPRSRRARSRS